MTDRAPTELQHHVVPEQIQQLVHLPGMDPAGGHRHDARHARPVLIEEDPVGRVGRDVIVAQRVVEALGGCRVAFELADHGAGVQMVDPDQPFLRAQCDMDCMAVKPMVRSIITTTLPSSLANSARSYISSTVAAVTFK